MINNRRFFHPPAYVSDPVARLARESQVSVKYLRAINSLVEEGVNVGRLAEGNHRGGRFIRTSIYLTLLTGVTSIIGQIAKKYLFANPELDPKELKECRQTLQTTKKDCDAQQEICDHLIEQLEECSNRLPND